MRSSRAGPVTRHYSASVQRGDSDGRLSMWVISLMMRDLLSFGWVVVNPRRANRSAFERDL